ncbi:serine/threonine-protein kinase BRI1-like 1 [Hevea brasiliensis]|uniref:serine/threonine-protein kinase BRI1-like 1 n=1 Tax=Hevea brasiliensis TaxID=3981 RepID=UPI0025FED886|nr:serine/threonine-protein kinase BRI1-like 1 [Hevea brasiliensis]
MGSKRPKESQGQTQGLGKKQKSRFALRRGGGQSGASVDSSPGTANIVSCLVGEIPVELGSLLKLQEIYLETLVITYNNLGGELPEHIANFSKELHRFAIQHNQISGNIPVGIQVLVNLEAFYADRNKLSGTVPSGIGQPQNLKLLRLGGNNLSEYIPSSLGNLPTCSRGLFLPLLFH